MRMQPRQRGNCTLWTRLNSLSWKSRFVNFWRVTVSSLLMARTGLRSSSRRRRMGVCECVLTIACSITKPNQMCFLFRESTNCCNDLTEALCFRSWIYVTVITRFRCFPVIARKPRLRVVTAHTSLLLCRLGCQVLRARFKEWWITCFSTFWTKVFCVT